MICACKKNLRDIPSFLNFLTFNTPQTEANDGDTVGMKIQID